MKKANDFCRSRLVHVVCGPLFVFNLWLAQPTLAHDDYWSCKDILTPEELDNGKPYDDYLPIDDVDLHELEVSEDAPPAPPMNSPPPSEKP